MPTALIVGAGIGGLAAGIALGRAGWDIRIFERAHAPRDIGFALGLAPNAIAALGELGIADAGALEDAVGLGRAMKGRGDHVAALGRYEEVRSRHTRRVVKMGPRIARITTTRNPIVGFLRDTALRIVPEIAIVKALAQARADPHRALGERRT